jgi:predicted SprT family Zn-dependent metalloprotease
VEPAVGSVLSQDQLAEIIAHEIGHATDYLVHTENWTKKTDASGLFS